MPGASFTRAFYLQHLSSPRCDRVLYRMAGRTLPKRIVEVGVNIVRAGRLIELLSRFAPNVTVEYTGIDLFEARSTGEALTLKTTHHRLSQTDAKVRLVPGELVPVFSRTANMLANTDLIIFDAVHADEALQNVWQFIPRMVGSNTKIARYVRTGGTTSIRWLPLDAFSAPSRRAA